MHWLGLIVIVVVAGVVAMILLQRIYDAQQKLAALHDDLRRNNLKLQSEFSRLETQSTHVQPAGAQSENIQEEEKP
jgi:hypothetical protein